MKDIRDLKPEIYRLASYFKFAWIEFRVLEISPRLKYDLSIVNPFESKPAKWMSKSLSKPGFQERIYGKCLSTSHSAV